MSDGQGELILHCTEEGRTEVHLRAAGGTVWLTQAEMAALFETTPQNITRHIRGGYEEGELTEAATCKEDLQVRQEGGREVRRTFLTFNERDVLAGPGRISHEQMEAIVSERYATFDARRRADEALAADQEADDDLKQLQAEAKRLAGKHTDTP